MHTSIPFRAVSTGLWLFSMLVTIPISTNCNKNSLFTTTQKNAFCKPYFFAGYAQWSTLLHNAGFHYHSTNDGIPGVEHELGQNAQPTRKDRDVLKLFSFLLLQFVAVRHEFVEQMIDDVSLEDFHSHTVSQFLCIFFHFYVER